MFIDETDLLKIKSLMRKETEPDCILKELIPFFYDTFKCRLYDYLCFTSPDGRLGFHFVVWDKEAKDSFYIRTENFYGLDREKERLIKDFFSKLCIKYQMHPQYKDPSEYFATPTDIYSDLISELGQKTREEIEAYLQTRSEVKKTATFFGSLHIFYETDKDIELNSQNGISDDIIENIAKIRKKYDEFGIYGKKHIVFDSIQTLNEKYGGSFQYYFN